MSEGPDEATEALEPISYLSRSANRFQVVEALTEKITEPGLETPGYEPRELRDMTGASEATISRLLNEFDERGWVERDVTGEYTATPLGQSIAIEFTPLIDSMEAIQHLGDAVALLPLNELTISLEHFRNATVREPTGPPKFDWGRYFIDLLNESSTLYSLTYVIGSAELGNERIEQIRTGQLESVEVWPESVMEYIPPEDIEAGADMFVHPGHFPCNIFILDETVVIENSQVNGLKDGTVIETRNPTVREWAIEFFERYLNESEKLTVKDLAE